MSSSKGKPKNNYINNTILVLETIKIQKAEVGGDDLEEISLDNISITKLTTEISKELGKFKYYPCYYLF